MSSPAKTVPLHRSLLVAALLAMLSVGCGDDNAPPSLIGVADPVAFVGSEFMLELTATDDRPQRLEFGFETTVERLTENARIQPTGVGGSAIFRWTPAAQDVGFHVVDFKVSDGGHTIVETVTIEVRPTADGAPIFRRPLAAGATLVPEESRCLEVPILVEDADTVGVEIREEAPLIPGASLEQTGVNEALWTWCPSREEMEGGPRVLVLAADDGDNPPVLRHFLVAVRSQPPVSLAGWLLFDPEDPCFLILPEVAQARPGGAIVIAQNAERRDFEAAWDRKLDDGVAFVNAAGRCGTLVGRSFSLADPDNEIVDGATPSVAAGEALQRVLPNGAATESESWEIRDSAQASPGDGRVPAAPGTIYVSEISDAAAAGAQFLEIAVD